MNHLIAKGATKIHSGEKKTFFYDSARSGMLDFLKHSHITNCEKLLIPGYIGWSPREGSGVFDPITESGISYDFYELNADLTVNLESLGELLSKDPRSMVLIIDYFGFSDPNLNLIANMIAKSNSVLIRDLAHALVGNFHHDPDPREGHVRLFSLHKSLPLSLGGAVDYPLGHLVSGQKSNYSVVAEQMLSYNFEKISSIRRENYKLMKQLLQDLSIFNTYFTFLRDPLPNDVPHTFPVIIVSDCRDLLYESLNEQGIGVVSLYHTLIPEVAIKQQEIQYLSKHIINLPIHQDLGRNDIFQVVACFEENLTRISNHF